MEALIITFRVSPIQSEWHHRKRSRGRTTGGVRGMQETEKVYSILYRGYEGGMQEKDIPFYIEGTEVECKLCKRRIFHFIYRVWRWNAIFHFI